MMADVPVNLDQRHIAMLIDGDNAQAAIIGEMLAETGKYGLITIRRVYGDWTTSNMNSWKETLHTHAIQPIQQFRYTTGKNATDSAMIIDAMDILYTTRIDGFCLVSSDSDYTRLATRIREKSLFVMGIGKKMTPRAFVNACDVFVYTENLQPGGRTTPIDESAEAPDDLSEPPPWLPLFENAFDLAVQDDGWAFLGALGHHLRQLDPGFDSRSYGYKQLSQMVRAHPDLFKMRKANKKGPSPIYVRLMRS
ncbi:MAG: NYN domain-containing protein [Chloroflexi bacterium]|nr:NYN domain-containing protein [Chloroflexota bacterium]